MTLLSALSARADDELHTIRFQPGADQHVFAGAWFGLLASHDAGASWRWMCPSAVGYGGMYDPDYEPTATGALVATTFNGLRVMRDGCSFAATPLGMTFVSAVAVGPDGAVYAAAADPADTKIYKSTDDAATFPTSAAPAAASWWTSIVVAPSDAMRVYLAGYAIVGSTKQHYLYASTNGGGSFAPMSTAGLVTSANSSIELVGVSSTDPGVLYIEVTMDMVTTGHSIYRSSDAGASWTKILSRDWHIAFLASRSGLLVAGTRTEPLAESSDGGTTWTTLACSPHVACLAENGAGDIWACTHQFDADMIPPDGFAIMKRGQPWTGVMRLQDIAGPVACAVGTVQHDTCEPAWPTLDQRLDSTPTGTLVCPVAPDDAPGDLGARDDTKPLPAPQSGCCSTSGGPGSLVLALGVLLAMARSRGCCPACRATRSSRRRRCGSRQ